MPPNKEDPRLSTIAHTGISIDQELFLECGLQVDRHCLVAGRRFDAHFDCRFLLAPVERHHVGVRSRREGAGLEVERCARSGEVDEDRVLVGVVFGKQRHRAEPIVTVFLAEGPDLFNGASLLIDLVDDGAGILHFRKRRVFHDAGVAVVEGREIHNARLALRINALGPHPVEAPFASRVRAGDGLALMVDGLENLACKFSLRAARGAEDPLHLLVAADLDDGGLVARRDDDRIIGRVVVDGIHVRPVAADAGARNVAVVVGFIQLLDVFFGERLAGLGIINVEAHRTLVEGLDDVRAIGVEDVEETEFVDDVAS